MSRGRFGLLLGLIVVVVAVASFVVVLSLIDDDAPNGSGTSSTTTTTASTTTAPGALVTPTFVVVVSSEGDEPSAQLLRDELTESGYDAGVLRSDDYSSLEPGYWVTYVGPFPDVAGTNVAKDELVADGYSAAYSRCVGTAEECS
jgi:hypothetical protein